MTDRVEPGQILDVSQAAEMLGYHEETLRRLSREGAVPAFRIGRKWHYDKGVLAAWMGEQLKESHYRASVKQRMPQPPSLPDALVLIVDDQESIRDVYGRTMAAEGFQVETAENGQVAIEKMEALWPELLILDLVMPVVDGPGVLEYVRGRDTTLPVIITTGYPEGEVMARALKHGPFTLLPKPVNRERLVNTAVTLVIGRALARRHRALKQ